jgi:DNA-directed RNA polymerase specialized sigma24 family protein
MDLQAFSQSAPAEHPNIYQPLVPTDGVRRVAARREPSGRFGPVGAAAEGATGTGGPGRGAAGEEADALPGGARRVIGAGGTAGAGGERGADGVRAGARSGGRRRRVALPDSASTTDLRRVRGGSMAMLVDTIVTRATQLPAADRQLLLSVYRDGQSVTSIALAACAGNEEACRVAARRGGRNDHDARAGDLATDAATSSSAGPRSAAERGGSSERGGVRVSSPAALLARALRRRVRQLAARLLEPKFVFVMREMRDWPTSRRAVAEAVVLHGLSLREAAAALSMSLHAVRREHAAVHALFTAREA